ncbi:unnamed protein product [Bursaphelenchus okinawaensis]|uniref:Sex-regulated protein janus-B n=1 Tax=Bursaphelenchus okinawaensis TaxID=465554 RepID=A0A811JSJ4_9BILA|nr:unnamed protein product [Bursaphelenchus okinawaensis]CAG9080586.1 unnamed protein product [Bursaphelenchus okinawaensis]
MAKLDSVANVDIDPKGTFKYILIKVTDPSSKKNKVIVRGYGDCGFHGDILDKVESNQIQGLSADCLGGGRIKHDADGKSIKVYGYSQGYGQADHKIAVDMLKQKYPDYDVTSSNDGY